MNFRRACGTSLIALASASAAAAAEHPPTPRFEISFPSSAHAGPITGRLVLVIGKTAQPEPRLTISPRGPALFAIDLDQLAPGAAAVIDDKALGYPTELSALPPGDYFAQAVISVYEQVHRADGKTLWLPMNDGNIEFFSNAAYNLYSDVTPIHVGSDGAIKLSATHVMPAYERAKDTEWIKQVSFQSPMLTKFWGRPIFIHASVLLPRGYAEHPTTSYPVVYTLGHGETPLNFSTTPPRNGAPNTVSPVTGVESGFGTYQKWNS